MSQPKGQVLLLSVGTGDVQKLRETLLEPLTKSIRKGDWSRVVLLPSQFTHEMALQLQEELRETPIELRPLPRAGAEDDADACFAHFDAVLGGLRAEGYPAASILVDFTRGTKAMSAALVLAAVRHALPRLRYICGGRRDERGMVVAGTEVVGEFRTAQVSGRRRLDEAEAFFRRGNYAAVRELLPAPGSPLAGVWPSDLLARAAFLRALAEFYAAWDRFDYAAAAGVVVPDAPPEWAALSPAPEVRRWLADLAQPEPSDNAGRAEYRRRLAADLLANGERRIRDQQYEEALLRSYRVLEILGEARLFARNIDPVALQLNRHRVLEELGRRRDPLAASLKAQAHAGAVKAADRHESILTHGYGPVAGGDPAPLRALYQALESLLTRDGGEAAVRRLALARSMPAAPQAGTPLALLLPA
jgi:CRISPR-associated protein (TIGR02710 family)